MRPLLVQPLARDRLDLHSLLLVGAHDACPVSGLYKAMPTSRATLHAYCMTGFSCLSNHHWVLVSVLRNAGTDCKDPVCEHQLMTGHVQYIVLHDTSHLSKQTQCRTRCAVSRDVPEPTTSVVFIPQPSRHAPKPQVARIFHELGQYALKREIMRSIQDNDDGFSEKIDANYENVVPGPLA